MTVRPAGCERDDADAGPVAAGPTPALVEVVREAHRRRGGVAPRSPWLPPLPDHLPWSPPLARGGAPPEVALGVVDEPDLQRVSPLRWAPADGTWVLTGRPRSGRTTALRSLVLSAASTLDPRRLHVHVVDPSATWSDVDALPHVGTRIGVDDRRALDALVTHLRDEVSRRAQPSTARRRAPDRPRRRRRVGASSSTPSRRPTRRTLVGRLLGVFRDGGAVGVVGAVAGGRSLLQPRWAAVAGRTFLVGAVDALDAAVTGLRAADLPRDPPAGRAIRVHDRREVQFAMPSTDDPPRVASAAGRGPLSAAPGACSRCRRSPARRDVPGPAAGLRGEGAEEAPGLAVGVSGPSLDEWSWRPSHLGRRLLVAGPAGSGRSNALRALSQAALTAGRPVLVVTDRVGHRRFPGATVVGPADVGTLVEVRRRHPHLLLLVDDADRLDDAAVAARPARGRRARGPRPWARGRRHDDDVPGRRGSGASTSTSRATGPASCSCPHPPTGTSSARGGSTRFPRMPGRGVVVGSGRATEIQVFLEDEDESAAASVGSDPGNDLGVVLAGDPRGDGAGEGHDNDHPADERPVALHEAHPDRQQEHAPDQGRGAGPRAVAEPPAGQQGEPCRPHEDQQGRHHAPGWRRCPPRAAAREVEDGDSHEGQRLHPEEHGRDAAGAA